MRNPTGPLEARSYDYDPSGNLTRRSRQAENRTYTYDGLDRLVQEALEGAPTPLTDYAYDPNGSRLARTMGPDLDDTYAFTPAGNRLALIETLTRGSTPPPPAVPNREYHYNQAGRVFEVIENGLLKARYTYNAEGQRTRKVLFSGGTLQTGTTLYYYDLGGQLIAETTEDGTPLRDYLWHDDERLAQIDTAQGFETLLYLYTDHLKTPRLATGQSGAILWRWEGEAFGSAAPELASATINLRFPGQYFDAETGLHYNYFRDYDPSIERYIQSDPIGLAGGLNTYAYVANNPIAYADPRGLIDPFDEPPSRGIGELLDRLFSEGADGGVGPSAKPGSESRPKDAPPGTKPIDKAGLGSGDVHDVKDAIGAGPRDWVGIAPNGDVITSDPAGNAINHGPVDDYTRRPTGLCP